MLQGALKSYKQNMAELEVARSSLQFIVAVKSVRRVAKKKPSSLPRLFVRKLKIILQIQATFRVLGSIRPPVHRCVKINGSG